MLAEPHPNGRSVAPVWQHSLAGPLATVNYRDLISDLISRPG